jgi:hypothetical protein
MKKLLVALALLLATTLGIGGYFFYQDGLVPVPLAEEAELFAPAKPEYGEDQARVEVVMPPGMELDAFLARQAALPVIQINPSGAWTGVLARELSLSRNGRRLRFRLRPGWNLQGGGQLDAAHVQAFWAPIQGKLGFQTRVIDAATVEVRFPERQASVLVWLSRWLLPGTGPYTQSGSTLTRFDRFHYGKAGIAEIKVQTDPAQRESRAWADGLASARWAWAVFPGKVAPEDMARVRMAPYDEFRMKDGSVWFLSRRLRRLRPDAADWTRTRLFGVWKGSMDLPYDPLGM